MEKVLSEMESFQFLSGKRCQCGAGISPVLLLPVNQDALGNTHTYSEIYMKTSNRFRNALLLSLTPSLAHINCNITEGMLVSVKSEESNRRADLYM